MIKYGQETNHVIILDSCFETLNVEKRRVYDILNIFEAFNSVTKKAKNMYVWKGFASVIDGLQNIIYKCESLKQIQMPNSTDRGIISMCEDIKKYKCHTTKSLGFL